MSRFGKSQGVASLVTIAGVAAIWAMGAWRQEGQTEALARRWAGEQWDVARRCLVGTPIGRSEGVEALREKLEHELVWDVVRQASSEHRWPARCAALLPSLDVSPSILRTDPGDALSTLNVLVSRVLTSDAEGVFSMREAAARARELAEPIALLDAAMPSGAEYDPASFARPDVGVPARAVLASLACPERDSDAAPCTAPICESAPALEGAPPLAMLATEHALLAITLAPGTDLPLARVFRGEAWSEPVPVPRGTLSVEEGVFRIESCEGTFSSEDGLRWRAKSSSRDAEAGLHGGEERRNSPEERPTSE